MAISYISSNARPSDNSTFGGNANNSLLINAVGAATGDLVVVVAQYRGATTIVVDETGGQSWNSLTAFIDAANQCQIRIFWCRWSDENANGNNPNWYANGISGTPFTCTGFIFRPTTSSNQWAVDASLASTQFSAPSSPFTITRTGVTTTNASTVTIATWHTADLNTWGSLSGTGWNVLGDAQYRNATGSGQSSSLAYKIMSSAGATGNVSKNQATNGGDAGVTSIISFYEFGSSDISGTSSGTTTLSAAIAGTGNVIAASAGSVSLSASLSGTSYASAITTGTVTVTGTLNSIAAQTGNTNGTSTTTGIISASGYLTCSISSAGVVNGSLVGIGYLNSDSTGAAAVIGLLQSASNSMQGSATGSTICSLINASSLYQLRSLIVTHPIYTSSFTTTLSNESII